MATEEDKINTGALATLVAVGVFATLAVALGVDALVRFESRKMEAERAGYAEAQVRDLEKEQRAQLAAQPLPIERAMAAVVLDLRQNPWSATPPAPEKDAGADDAAVSEAADGGADAAATDADGGGAAPEGAAAPTAAPSPAPSAPAPAAPQTAPTPAPKPPAPAVPVTAPTPVKAPAPAPTAAAPERSTPAAPAAPAAPAPAAPAPNP